VRALIHESTPNHLIATWESVVIPVWRVETTMSGVLMLDKVFDAAAQQYPSGVFLLTIVEPNAPVPTPDVRKAMALMLTKWASRLLVSAVVHEGTGFRAAMVRSVVIGVAMLTKLPFRHKVFSTIDEAARWFAATSATAAAWGGEKPLVDAVAEVRARVVRSATA